MSLKMLMMSKGSLKLHAFGQRNKSYLLEQNIPTDVKRTALFHFLTRTLKAGGGADRNGN